MCCGNKTSQIWCFPATNHVFYESKLWRPWSVNLQKWQITKQKRNDDNVNQNGRRRCPRATWILTDRAKELVRHEGKTRFPSFQSMSSSGDNVRAAITEYFGATLCHNFGNASRRVPLIRSVVLPVQRADQFLPPVSDDSCRSRAEVFSDLHFTVRLNLNVKFHHLVCSLKAQIQLDLKAHRCPSASVWTEHRVFWMCHESNAPSLGKGGLFKPSAPWLPSSQAAPWTLRS